MRNHMPTLRCIQKGSGVPWVFLHAFPLSNDMWQKDIAALASRFRVIAPDLPGFGQSDRLPQPSIAGMAGAVAGLLDSLKFEEPVVLCGLSMGGYVALEFIRQFPERVKALGLFSTRAAADSPEQRAGRLKLIDQLKQEGNAVLIKASLPKLIGRTSAASRPEIVSWIEQRIRTASVDGIVDAVRAMADRSDSQPLLPAIACPVLIIAGDEDALIPPQESESMARAISGSRLEIVPQAGHLANLERPEAFQQVLASWRF